VKDELVPTAALPDVVEEPRARTIPGETDWKRAFATLGIGVGGGFIDSDSLSRFVDAVRREAGDEAAALLAHIFNSSRSKWVHDLMG
jgi:hypothetical protein